MLQIICINLNTLQFICINLNTLQIICINLNTLQVICTNFTLWIPAQKRQEPLITNKLLGILTKKNTEITLTHELNKREIFQYYNSLPMKN